MEQYTVTGMSCAACAARVEKAVRAVPGVESCAVSLLTNSMGVEGNADEQSIIAAVEAAGYGARRKGAEKNAPHSYKVYYIPPRISRANRFFLPFSKKICICS